MRKTVCLAYFGNEKFLGWYSDSFGTISKSSPKLYNYSKEQMDIIKTNLAYKFRDLDKNSTLAKHVSNLAILDNSLNRDKGVLSQYTNISIKAVECPEYEGPNPDFDKEAYEKMVEARRQELQELGVLDLPPGSIERLDALDEYNITHPEPKCNNWIHADYAKVKAWASNEPTEFVETIFEHNK